MLLIGCFAAKSTIMSESSQIVGHCAPTYARAVLFEMPERRASVAKATGDCIAFVPGINRRPTTQDEVLWDWTRNLP